MGVLEAMKFGLALVTTPVGGIPDVVVDGENGLLIEPGNADAVAAALRHLLGNADLAKRLGAAARDAVTAFEPDRLADDWKRLYREVTQEEDSRKKS
jgi:glycosyltransferase involved in cell wall biosynthesis